MQAVAIQENAQRVNSVSAEQWFAIYEWAKRNGTLNSIQLSLLLDFATNSANGKPLQSRQISEGIKILDKIVECGYRAKT